MTNEERKKLHALFRTLLRAASPGASLEARNEAYTCLYEWTTLWPTEEVPSPRTPQVEEIQRGFTDLLVDPPEKPSGRTDFRKEFTNEDGSEVWVAEEAAAGWVNLYQADRAGDDTAPATASSLWYTEAREIAQALLEAANIQERRDAARAEGPSRHPVVP